MSTRDRADHHQIPAADTADTAEGLESLAASIGGHRFIERELFMFTGKWSVEPAADPVGAACAVFLATQSELHAWRLAEWETRSPRSVDTLETAPDGWADAMELTDRSGSIHARTACWVSVLAPQLASRYLEHRAQVTSPAGVGLSRWLDIAIHDVLRGVAEGGPVLRRAGFELPGDGDLDGVLRALTRG
ncbi:MAG: hypothetical protein ACK5O2_15245 [Microthrixaceae bacterium]